MADPEKSEKHPLGAIVIEKDALDQDWKLADGYIAYSSELLRLSLLAITGIATLCIKLQAPSGRKFAPILYSFALPLGAFIISAGCALAHRFVAIDSMAFHISSLRLSIRSSRAQPDSDRHSHPDHVKSRSEAKARDLRFWLAERLLWMSAFALFAGLALSVLALARW